MLGLIEEISAKEVKEIVLTGVNIGDFGIQNGTVAKSVAPSIQQVDWAMVHSRLRSAGSVTFQSDKTSTGHRVLCMIPGKLPGSLQRFESHDESEAQAVQMLLEKLNEWQSGK